MNWLPKLMDFVVVAVQISAGLYLAYGGYLFARYLGLPSIPDKSGVDSESVSGRRRDPAGQQRFVFHALRYSRQS